MKEVITNSVKKNREEVAVRKSENRLIKSLINYIKYPKKES